MLRLKKFQLDTSDPKWSSYALDRFLGEVMSAPDASVRDVYQGLDAALRASCVELTPTVAAFIKEIVVQCFTRYRQSYESVNWTEAVDMLSDKATAAQLYLALHAIPPRVIGPQSAEAIAQGLETTAFRDEAAIALGV
jgi:hypothetical protein